MKLLIINNVKQYAAVILIYLYMMLSFCHTLCAVNIFVLIETLKLALQKLFPFFGTEHRARYENIFVASSAHVYDNCFVFGDFASDFHSCGTCVSAFERKQHAFIFCKEADCFKRIFVENRSEFDAS